MAKYNGFLSSFGLSYPKLMSISDRYYAFVSFGSMSWKVGPLCAGQINVWLSLAGPQSRKTVLFGLAQLFASLSPKIPL